MTQKSRTNNRLRLEAVILIIALTVSLGFGIVLAPVLNQFHFGGFPLGFWFAQQGAIIIFVVLLWIYAHKMEQLEKQHPDHKKP